MSELDTILAGIDSGSDDPLGTGDDGGVIGDRTTQARRSDAVPTTTTRRRTGRRSQRDTGVTLPEVTPEEAAQVESQVQQDDVMGGGPTPNPGSTVPARQQEELATEQPERQIPIVDSGGRPLGIVANVRLSDETDDIFILNDLVFKIPPLAIQIVKHSFTQTEKTLRTSNAMKSKSGQSECEIIFTIAFVGRDQFRKHLRRLIANFKYAPIAFIENSFVRNQVNPDFIFGPGTSMAVILESLSVTTVEQQPETLMAECRCKLFNYKPFSSNFFYKKDWHTRGQLGVQESILGDLDALTSRFGSQAIRPNVAADDINGPPSAFLAADQQGLVGTSPVRFPGNSQGFNLLIKTALDEKMDYVPDSWTNKIKFSFREYRRVSLPPELVEVQSRPTAIRPTPLPPAQPAPVTPAASLEPVAPTRSGSIEVLPDGGVVPHRALRGGNEGTRSLSPVFFDPNSPTRRFISRIKTHPVRLFAADGRTPISGRVTNSAGGLRILGAQREALCRGRVTIDGQVRENVLYVDNRIPYNCSHAALIRDRHTGLTRLLSEEEWAAGTPFNATASASGSIQRVLRRHAGLDIAVISEGNRYFGPRDYLSRAEATGMSRQGRGSGASWGACLVSPVDGRVINSHGRDVAGGRGRREINITIRGDDGLFYFITHMLALAPGIENGTRVVAGQLVGYIGATGTQGFPHLHIQIQTTANPTGRTASERDIYFDVAPFMALFQSHITRPPYIPNPASTAPSFSAPAARQTTTLPSSPQTTRTRQTEQGPVTTPTPGAQAEASQAITSAGTRFEISQNAQQIFNSYIAQNAVNGWRFYSEQLPQVMDVFYRDYEDADGVGLNILHEDEELVPVGANVVYQNSFATIPLLSHQYPTYQFMGGNDCVFAIRFNGIGQEKLQRLQLMFDLMESNARNFRFVKDSAIVNISDNEFLNLFSVKRLVTENIEVRTHASNPNLYDVTLTFSEFKTTKEMLVRENTTARGLVEQILRRVFNGANSGAGNDFLRANPNVAIADRAREVAWLRSQMEAIVDQIHRTETRIFSPEVSGPYGDLYGAERLLHGTFRGADASIIDQVQAGSSLDPATQVRRGVRRGGDALASIIEAASNLSGVDSQGLPAQIRAGTGNTPGTSERDREIREQNTSQLRELRARLLSIGEQIYNHGADGEFDDFFPEVARAISSGEGDQQLSGSAYPDLILPLHPSTNRSLDVNPDFYFWNDNSDGGIARLLENDLLAAQGFLSNSYQSFSSIVGIDGDTDWFTKEYLSRTVQSIDQQAQNNANGTPANPYRTMYGWDGSPGATNSSQIGTPSTFFDNLLKTSSGTRVPLVADFTGNRTPYRVLIEATYGTGQNPVSFGARNGERNPLAEHNFSLSHVKSLLNEAIMSFKESALKMARAFPTFKLYFLQENSQSPSHFVSFDDFYSYSSVKEIRITRHRKIPAGLCMIRLTNLSGILSNASYWNRANNPNMIFANGRGEDNGGIPSGNLQVYNPFRHDLGDDARHENAFDALLLKEGCKIQVRMGYDNNADNLPIVFTGQIVEISNAGRPDELAIVAQDYGVELVLEQKGKDPEQQATFSDTMELLCGMICSPELLHFGRWDLNTEYSPFEVRSANSNRSVTTVGGYLTNWILPVESINRFMLKWQFLNDPQDDNLFPPPANTYIAQGILGSFIDSVFGNNSENACKYTPQGNTVWDVFKEMELRHPGWIAQPEYYGDRMTMFFGIPSQRYWARPFSAREQMVQRRANRERDGAEQQREGLQQRRQDVQAEIREASRELAAERGHLADREAGLHAPLAGNRVQRERTMANRERAIAAHRANIQALSARIVAAEQILAQDAATPLRIDQLNDVSASLANGRLKAFRSYHLLTSFNHIISNEIKASSKNLPNAIQVGYYDLAPSLGTFGANPQEVADSLGIRTPFGNNNFDYLKVMSIKADDNISDHMTQYAYYTSPNCRTRFLARRYACALIARNLKDAYKGRLIVTGEPKIKPYDLCYIFDSYTDMFGPCEVKGVTHIFDEDGFRTEIMPDMVVNINEWSCCGVMDALQLVAMRLGVIHGQFSTTGRDIDAFVVNNAGTILGGAAAVGTAGGVAAAVAPRLGAGVGTSPALLAYPLVAPAALLAAGTAYLAMWGGLKYIQWTQERQPVIVTPLLFGGKPFVAGLDGFKQDGLVSNTLGKFRRWSEDFGLGLQGLLAGGRIDQLQAEVMRSLGASTTGLAILGRGVGGVIAP